MIMAWTGLIAVQVGRFMMSEGVLVGCADKLEAVASVSPDAWQETAQSSCWA